MQAKHGVATGRVRLFGQAQSSEAYQIRDLLTRSVVAFDWIELGSDEDCLRELGLAISDARLPVVELPDGGRIARPFAAGTCRAAWLGDAAKAPRV